MLQENPQFQKELYQEANPQFHKSCTMKKYVIICVLVLLIIVAQTFFRGNGIKRRPNFDPKADFLICMFLTGGLKEEAENSIQTLKYLGLSDKLVVTALDDEAYIHIRKLGVKVVKRQTNLKRLTKWGSKSFRDINLNKYDIVLDLLQREKKIVVYADPDVVFLKDISDDIVKFNESNYDVMIQNDVSRFNEKDKTNFCAGFIFFKPNEKTVAMVRRTQKKTIEGYLDDQYSLNMELNNKGNGINFGIFSLKDYPNGKRYFDHVDTIYKSYRPMIVHNNYLMTTNLKIRRLKKHGLWFLPPRWSHHM